MASKVHRVRFYNPKPQPINCASFNSFLRLLAVARADASIEIWDLNRAPCVVRFIPGIENGSVEALGWAQHRLLATGLSGALIEWDVAKQRQKNSVLLTGYAAWCLDVNNDSTLVAVGTEQGYINLYSLENNEIVYKKLFDKQEGRVMCCKFNKDGNVLVTGSIDTIRVWNVDTGHATTRMSVTRRKKEAIVWSVGVLSDNTIISGDSYGRLTFWDSSLGEQIDSYTTHKGDVLSIAVSPDERHIFCSGKDPTIVDFIKVSNATNKNNKTQFVKHIQRNIHEHDVRALVMDRDTLISVGVDGYLTFSRYPPKWEMRVPPMISMPRSSVCPLKKLLLLRYSDYLEVWKLGSYGVSDSRIAPDNSVDTSMTSNKIDHNPTAVNGIANDLQQSLRITRNPVKLATIRTKGKKHIQCCDMSPSGEFIVYSTNSDTRILKLDTDDVDEDQSNISLSKVLLSGVSGACDLASFTQDSRGLVLYSGAALHVLQVDPEAGALVVQTIPLDKFLRSPSLLHLTVSKQSTSGVKYIAVADIFGAIEVLVEKKKKFTHHVTLATYECVPCAMTVDSDRETLIVVYVDHTVVEYDLISKRYTQWRGTILPREWYARTSPIVSVTVHPARNALVLHDDTSLWTIDRNAVEPDEPEIKKRSDPQQTCSYSVIPIKYLAGFHWLGDDEAVTIEILPENIVSQLPAPVQVNKWEVRL